MPPLRSRLVLDRLRDFLPDRMSKCRGARGWARAAHSAIHKLILLTQIIPQPIKSARLLHLTKHSGWQIPPGSGGAEALLYLGANRGHVGTAGGLGLDLPHDLAHVPYTLGAALFDRLADDLVELRLAELFREIGL